MVCRPQDPLDGHGFTSCKRQGKENVHMSTIESTSQKDDGFGKLLSELRKEDNRPCQQSKALKMTTTKLVQNCPTRWNSDLAQLESITALLPAMEQIVGPDGDTSGSELKKLMPDESEISKVKTIIRILKLFETFSNSVTADKTVTIHKVVPMLVTIKLGLETTQKLMKDPLIQEVTNYFLLEIDRRFPH